MECSGPARLSDQEITPEGSTGIDGKDWGEKWLALGVKTERIKSDRPTDRRLTERKNGFGRIVTGYGHGYG
jgi:hypothetical protein